MSEFIELDAKAPATLGAVVEAITRLSTLGAMRFMSCYWLEFSYC